MMLIMTELNGTLEAETINPESEEKGECRVVVEDRTRVRMTDYLSDYFTDESYLIDALALGPTATNIAVTQAMQFYGGGVYYNPEECRDYIDEDIPEECLEDRSGRVSYTCLKVDTPGGQVNCAEVMPKHCDIFFNPPENVYHHSITAVGYGVVRKIFMIHHLHATRIFLSSSGRGWSRVLEAEEQLGRGVGGGRLHEDSQGAGSLQSGHIHLSTSVQLRVQLKFKCKASTKLLYNQIYHFHYI